MFTPQISGDPMLPGEVTEKASVTHCPMDPPKIKKDLENQGQLKFRGGAIFVNV